MSFFPNILLMYWHLALYNKVLFPNMPMQEIITNTNECEEFTMNFNDAIKKSVLEGFSYADMSNAKIFTTLIITFLIAVYIFIVYKKVTKSAFYFKNFNISMAIISVVTAGIILAMQSSIVISLGMVGALSIVRFRTAIKDPMDLLFLFWSIGTGIICGAGLYKIAVILAVLVTIGLLILDLFSCTYQSLPFDHQC